MAKNVEEMVTPEPIVAEVDYSELTMEELLEAIGKAYSAKPPQMKLMGQLSKLYTKKEGEAEKAKKDALLAELIAVTQEALSEMTTAVDLMVEEGKLDGAEGIWFAYDFGAIREKGINPSCKLIKGSKRAASGEGTGSGKSSYVANPAKSADLLAQVGEHEMFPRMKPDGSPADDVIVTIDKVEQTIPAGTTFKEAYEHSTNGGWRNRCRMALLKEAGII